MNDIDVMSELEAGLGIRFELQGVLWSAEGDLDGYRLSAIIRSDDDRLDLFARALRPTGDNGPALEHMLSRNAHVGARDHGMWSIDARGCAQRAAGVPLSSVAAGDAVELARSFIGELAVLAGFAGPRESARPYTSGRYLSEVVR